MDFLKKLVEVSFSPVGVMTILFLAGLLGRLFLGRSRTSRAMLTGGALLFVVYLFSPLAELTVSGLERDYPPLLHPDASTGVKTVVVLSGYGEDHAWLPPTSRLSGETICRLGEGIRLCRELPGSRLILSGGVAREGDRPVAALMADYAQAVGVPAGAVTVEVRSQNTYENLVEVQKIVGEEPFILVTSACDLRRAMAVARKLEMKATAAPVAYFALPGFPAGMSWRDWSFAVLQSFALPSITRLSYLQRAWHEYAGYLWYRLLERV